MEIECERVNRLKKVIVQENGLTLVELLATVTIIFLVSIFVFNIIFSATHQNQTQTAESQQINDAAFVLKQITKDIRKTYSITIDSSNNNHYYFTDKNNNILTEYLYSANGDLHRKGQILANNVRSFSFSTDMVSNTVTVSFTLNSETYSTTLAFRRGDE